MTTDDVNVAVALGFTQEFPQKFVTTALGGSLKRTFLAPLQDLPWRFLAAICDPTATFSTRICVFDLLGQLSYEVNTGELLWALFSRWS
ncbi:hypothetical protein ACX80L_15655 [Arthrobacter sp. MDT1-48-3]